MANRNTELLSVIGAMQTLIENYPFGINTAYNAKRYSSSLEFLLDSLRRIGVNDHEIITFILEELIGVNDISVESLQNMDENDERFQNNSFIQGLETAVKFLLSEILANIVSCSVWPKIPNTDEDVIVDLPITVLDPLSLLDICPTTPIGMRKYTGIKKETTPYTIMPQSAFTDMNAYMWYCLNIADTDGADWMDLRERSISQDDPLDTLFNLKNLGYKKLRVTINEDFKGKTLFNFNRKYLESITIFSPKVIIMNLIDELLNGLPNIGLNWGLDSVYNASVFEKMIDMIVQNDDMELNDCYYTFSNDDWNRMLEDAELRKYSARKVSEDTRSAMVLDKDSVINALNEASSASTLHDKLEIVSRAITNVATSEHYVQGGFELKFGFDVDINNNWLSNLLGTIIHPIVKAAMTPKVMALLLINYELAGAVNLSEIDVNKSVSVVFDFFKTKMLGLFAALVKKIKDLVVDAVIDLFKRKVEPLIRKYITAKFQEQLEYYMDLLNQALECIALFGWMGGQQPTSIDEVNYADITQVKSIPNKSIC